jgi:hypothetical protein
MTNQEQKDLVRRRVSFAFWWGLPIAIGLAADFLHLPFRIGAALCAVLFLWMATGCLLNAMRCHRLHCYISGPVFLLGALFATGVALGIVAVSAHTFGNVVGATLILALLSFVPEFVWKKYA